jgi:glucose/arabinose dehydrogenase
VAWDQPASSASELAQYTYVVYIDGTRTALGNATCGSTAAQTGYPCTAPLPALSVGQHTLQVAAVISSGGTTVEGDRSAAITVTRTASLTSVGPAASANAASRTSVLSDASIADEIGKGLAAPTSLAPAPDGRVFIATRTGIVVLQNGRVADPPAMRIDQAIADEKYELDLALAPRFADSHVVFVSQTAAAAGGGSVTKITRYREVQGMLGEAVVLRELPLGSSAGRSRIRVGPDEKLYVAISDEATSNQTAARMKARSSV